MVKKIKTAEKKMPDNSSPVEYHCSVFFKYNKLKKQQEYCIRLETAKVFSTLSYKLTVKALKKKNALDLNITGLLPDQTYLSEVKPAICDNIFNELYGDYTVNIIKQDGSINSARFNFNIFKQKIIMIESFTDPDKTARQFCSFQTAEDLNTFI